VEKSLDDFECRSLANVIGIGFEGNPPYSDPLPTEVLTEAICDFLDKQFLLLDVDIGD